jgi:ABC transporter family protein
MRRPRSPVTLGFLVLLLLVEVYLVRVARHLGAPRLELGRARLSRLDAATRRRLESLGDEVFITYYTSERSRMPSRMRGVERGVTDLLEAMRRASGARLDYQVLDPDSDPDLARYAAQKGVAPFRARSVERDAYSERTIWSTLAIAHGPRPESVMNGIGPEHLPRLQSLILEYLEQMERPRKPIIAIASAGGASELAGALAAKAEVRTIDLTGGREIPPDADVLFWLDPREAGPERIREVHRFLDAGRSVVVAASEKTGDVTEGAGGPMLAVRPAGPSLEGLLSSFGLRPRRGLFLDKNAGQLAYKDQRLEAPFLLRSNAYCQNFRGLRGQPNGNLLFLLPTPLALDADRLREAGLTAQELVTSSENTAVAPIPAGPIPIADLAPEKWPPAPKETLMVLLKPDDPWKGSLVACAAATPFEDRFFREEGTAHGRLLQTLLDNLAPPSRLVIDRAGILPVEPLPEMSWTGRLVARGLCVFMVPAVLLGLACVRGAFARRTGPAPPRSRWLGAQLLKGALALAAVLLAAAAAGLPGLRLDLTRESVNRLSPTTRELASRGRGEGAVSVEKVFSAPERLPPDMKPHLKRLDSMIGELKRAGAELKVASIHPEDLGEEGRQALAASGIEPVKVSTREEEETTVRTVWSSLRLSARGRSEVIRLPDPAAFEDLEFRIAFALWRLATGRRPLIGFVGDFPRLSPAEAHEYYQTQGLFPPMGTDVYSLARDLLESSGFRVAHVNSREPVLPDDLDLLVWLQPRRSIEKMLEAATRYLHQGGRLLLAAQHFNIQGRQFRGSKDPFKIVYWPQPQTPDVERYYFRDIGIDLVREVLFDDLKTAIASESQVNRAVARPDFERQDSALPFLIRAAAANFAPRSPYTAGAGDQAFIWGAFLRLDGKRLADLGIRATTLITTSERAWSFAWKGGWIPDDLLVGPPAGQDGGPAWLGRVPLAALFEGVFPTWEKPKEETAKDGGSAPAGSPAAAPPAPPPTVPESSAPAPAAPSPAVAESNPPAAPPPPGRDGKLLFIGCSEMFKNHRLMVPGFRADHLLLDAAAALSLGDELAAVAGRRAVPRGFDYVEPRARLLWRLLVIGAGPAALIVLGLGLASRRRLAGGRGRR